MEINLSGKKAIVAGGGGAIGFAIAKGLSTAGAALFLVSDDASWIMGTALVVDGGRLLGG